MSTRTVCVALLVALAAAPASAWQRSGPAAKLVIQDAKVGKGPKLADGDLAVVLYEGKLKDGTVFDGGFSKNALPLSFVVGKREVIPGWDRGVVGMRVGGIRNLVIPPSMAYGGTSNGKIPANATLYFKVQLIDVVKKGEERYFDKTDLKVGKGRPVRIGDTVTLDYRGTLANGKEFDSTYKAGQPVTITLIDSKVLKAFQLGIVGMRAGGKRRLRLPPAVAFGFVNRPDVPRNSVVYYEIVLRKVSTHK